MRREVLAGDLEQLYTANDMAKVGCKDCLGCWDCCEDMGESVILDPLDVWRLSAGLQKSFPALMQDDLELHVVDGIVLPNLKMAGPARRCVFLNRENRCSVHPYRPGFCRMFPLGRYYQDGSFRYFLQSRECRRENRTKVKISKWLDTPQLKQYEEYVLVWHQFLLEAQALLEEGQDERLAKDLNVYLLEHFYGRPYAEGDFYAQFAERLAQMKKLLRIVQKNGDPAGKSG